MNTIALIVKKIYPEHYILVILPFSALRTYKLETLKLETLKLETYKLDKGCTEK